MGLYCWILLTSLLTHACMSVKVTLEGAKTGTVPKLANKGSSVTLTCNAVSSTRPGEPKLEWLFDTSPIATGTHVVYDSEVVPGFSRVSITKPYSLTINDLVPADTGFYTCRVVLIGDTPSASDATYNFTVLVPPDEDISCGFPGDLLLTLGQPASFQCKEVEPQAHPPPTFTWYKNGEQLPTKRDKYPRYTNTSFSYSQQNGKLEFSSVVEGDVGNYYCEARNNAGSFTCQEATIKTKEVNVGAIVGIIFAVIFGFILIGVLVWWSWRRGYCDGLLDMKDRDDEDAHHEGANDVMLDGTGARVAKGPNDWSNGTKQEASLMI